jgi:hypothetical protein
LLQACSSSIIGNTFEHVKAMVAMLTWVRDEWGCGGRDQIVIRFLSPPPLDEPSFCVRIRPNELANHHETTTLDFDLRTWERL